MKRGILVYNPTAGQRDLRGAMSALIDRQRRRGLELVNAPTNGPGDATAIVKSFLSRGIDLVAVCGGDGTVSEAACGLVGSDVPIGVLPGGTSNVLARELGIPGELEGAEALLLDGVPRILRPGHADGRLFLLWAGVGIDARVMGQMNLTWKRRLGRTGIMPTAVWQFLRYEFPPLEVAIDGAIHEATYAVVSRVRHYGGHWIIAPEARPDTDLLEVMIFNHRSLTKLFHLFREMKAGRGGHLSSGLAYIARGRNVSIRDLVGSPVEIHVDGDCLLTTPVTCSLGEETVRVLVPAQSMAS
jgi:diacylglycerol kinase (ATP)